ncbi:MAG: hypothetical protein MMC33_005462 [Icmadophila ericetorum]|nr:hypothetical protein [Icmadophila ericetorum]
MPSEEKQTPEILRPVSYSIPAPETLETLDPTPTSMSSIPAPVEPFRPVSSLFPDTSLFKPITASFDSYNSMVGAGVAIFHLATSRVILCRHSAEKFWFLPKGRRDVNEESRVGAEREGFEESGYRNRLLPIPVRHRQPRPHNPSSSSSTAREQSLQRERVGPQLVLEPVWTQLMPQSRTCQYIVFWYIAETVPPDVEEALNAAESANASEGNPTPYQQPPPYPEDLTLAKRIKMEPEGYEPLHHAGTGVDEDERLYDSHLLPVEVAMRLLRGSTQEMVVRKGWEAICLRNKMEIESEESG